MTAALAVFFSTFISGCYTKFGTPEPKTGERDYSEGYSDDYTYDEYYYWDNYYPSFFFYPYYSYGYFYSPWWYDPGYYHYEDEYPRSGTKFERSRGHGFGGPVNPVNGGVYPPANPPLQPPSTPSNPQPHEEKKIRSDSDSGKKTETQKKDDSGGKSTRGRRR